MTGRMVSPNEMWIAAKQTMLNGENPKNDTEWAQVMNFIAFNVPANISTQIVKIMSTLYDCPLPDDTLEAIAKFQAQNKDESTGQ